MHCGVSDTDSCLISRRRMRRSPSCGGSWPWSVWCEVWMPLWQPWQLWRDATCQNKCTWRTSLRGSSCTPSSSYTTPSTQSLILSTSWTQRTKVSCSFDIICVFTSCICNCLFMRAFTGSLKWRSFDIVHVSLVVHWLACLPPGRPSRHRFVSPHGDRFEECTSPPRLQT